MADLGLILGAALAGGVSGAGQAGKEALQSQQQFMEKQDLINQQEQLDEQKQLRIQEAHHQFLNTQQENLFAHEDTTQASQQAFQGGQGDANRANALDVTSAQGENAMAVEKVRAATEMAISQATQSTALQVARMAHLSQSIVSTGDGTMYNVGLGNDGKPTSTMLTQADGSPLKGPKNMDASTGLFVKALMEQADLAKKNGDEAGADMATNRMSMLLQGASLKDVMGISATDVPPSDALKALVDHPDKIGDFKAKYPKYYATMLTGAAQATGATTTPAAAPTATAAVPAAASSATSTGAAGTPPLPPATGAAPDIGAGSKAPALIGGNLPPAATDPDTLLKASLAALSKQGTAKPIVAPAAAATPTMPTSQFAQTVQPASAQFGPKPGVLDGTGNGLVNQQLPNSNM